RTHVRHPTSRPTPAGSRPDRRYFVGADTGLGGAGRGDEVSAPPPAPSRVTAGAVPPHQLFLAVTFSPWSLKAPCTLPVMMLWPFDPSAPPPQSITATDSLVPLE